VQHIDLAIEAFHLQVGATAQLAGRQRELEREQGPPAVPDTITR